MPLIILCGLPASGKTRRADELVAILAPRKCVVINDESLKLLKSTAYSNATEEKRSRASFLAAVERALDGDTFVIADGMNYIKGFRYQLYCLARSARTPHCVIHCLATEDSCGSWNTHRQDPYPPEVFEELLLRFEEPNDQTRWDRPTFSVLPIDTLPTADILAALDGAMIKAPSQSTTLKPVSQPDFVFTLDKITNEVIQIAFEHARKGILTITLDEEQVQLPSTRAVTMAEFRRHQRQFIHLSKQHPVDPSTIRPLFAQYLQQNILP